MQQVLQNHNDVIDQHQAQLNKLSNEVQDLTARLNQIDKRQCDTD